MAAAAAVTTVGAKKSELRTEVSLIMTRVSASLFDDSRMDKTLLLNLELKRSERRRNLRYRTSVSLDPDAIVKQNQEKQSIKRVEKTADEHAKDLEQWLKKMKCTGVTGIRKILFVCLCRGKSLLESWGTIFLLDLTVTLNLCLIYFKIT